MGRECRDLNGWARTTLEYTVEKWTHQRKLTWKLRWQTWSAVIPATVSGWRTTYCYVHLVHGRLYITEFTSNYAVRFGSELATVLPERHAALLKAILFYGQR